MVIYKLINSLFIPFILFLSLFYKNISVRFKNYKTIRVSPNEHISIFYIHQSDQKIKKDNFKI